MERGHLTDGLFRLGEVVVGVAMEVEAGQGAADVGLHPGAHALHGQRAGVEAQLGLARDH